MNLVVLADDAFTFLVSWEFMSLSSWALVMAHHRDPENRHAGYVYIVMASFGTLSLLLGFGLLAGGGGGYLFYEMRSAPPTPSRLGLFPVLLVAPPTAGAGAAPGWLPPAPPPRPQPFAAVIDSLPS